MNHTNAELFSSTRASEFVTERMASASEYAWSLGPNIFWAVFTLVFFFFLSRGIKALTLALMKRSSWDQTIHNLTAATTGVIVFIIGILVALAALGLNRAVMSLLAGAGIIGIALAFAFKDSASNLLAGIILAFTRPFRVGHLVNLNGQEGRVRNISLRTTLLREPTGEASEIPNQLVIENPIINYTKYGERRVDFEIGISYAEDLAFVKRIAKAAVKRLTVVKDVEVYYTSFGDSSINFVIRAWIPFKNSFQDYYDARDQIVIAVKKAFDKEGITIPFPIRTLDFGIKGGKPLDKVLK